MAVSSDQETIGISEPPARSNRNSALPYLAGPQLPKPCVHPLMTPLGTVLTGFEMSDHVWHRGLWFAIKFINGTNFWEENAPFGRQLSVSPPVSDMTTDGRRRVRHELDWASEATGPVFAESREVTSQVAGGLTIIDWASTLTAKQALVLDRTPYTTWGGYSGLTFRGSRELHDVSYEIPGGEVVDSVVGDPHDWVVLRARVDGGLNRRVSVGIVDHPANPRSPTSWYCRSNPGYAFFNAAFLFHGPMNVAAGDVLAFRYRVVFRDGEWAIGDFAGLANEFRRQS